MDLRVSAPKSPEEIFPLEVWSIIFDNLDSASDIATCYRTCQAWNELLKPKRHNFLMKELYPILAKYLSVDRLTEEPLDEILKLRHVSRFWKESVDSYLRNQSKINDIHLGPRCYGDDDALFLHDSYNFGINGYCPRRFLALDFPLDSNPFISRYLMLNDTDCSIVRSEVPELQVDFKKLLESFGSLIWSCYLRFYCRVKTDFFKLQKQLRCYLSLMPNLRVLRLKVISFISPPKQAKLLQAEPFPEMKHLRVLEMLEVPYSISVEILAQSKELRELSFQAASYESETQSPIMGVEIPNLQRLILPKCSDVELGWCKDWQLKVLELSIPWDQKVETIFKALESFGNSLEHVFFKFAPTHDNNRKLQKLRLNLPNLKKITLFVPFHLKTVDFIAECKALKEIELESYLYKGIFFGKKEAAASVIQFYKLMKSMQKSNIWQVLPNLQFFDIVDLDWIEKYKLVSRFTRRQHEKYSEECKSVQVKGSKRASITN